MTSPSASPSEGEIVESDSEKATKSLPSAQDTPVDRPSRKRSPPSRSPSPYRPSRRRDRESRSRSPYRADRRPKRGREDDHYDNRNQRQDAKSSAYYDRQDTRRPAGRPSYRDIDRDQAFEGDLRYDDQSSSARSREKRPRTLSRSPPRVNDRQQGFKSSTLGVGSGGSSRPHTGSNSKDGSRRWSKEQTVGDRRAAPANTYPKTDAEPKKNQAAKSVSFKLGGKHGVESADKYVPPLRARPGADFCIHSSSAVNQDAQAPAAGTEPVDEATLIEQRRKRREAIMAKHKGQANPLLVQALTPSNATTPTDSLPNTPGSASQALG